MTNRDHSPSIAQNDGGDAKLRTEGSGQANIAAMAETWGKRSELRELRKRCCILAGEIEAEDAARRRSHLTQLGAHQKLVLAVLAERFDPHDWLAFNFRGLTDRLPLSRQQVQRACKALRRLGFAKLEIGLWDDEGTPFGSGYRATAEGAAWLLAPHPLPHRRSLAKAVRARRLRPANPFNQVMHER